MSNGDKSRRQVVFDWLMDDEGYWGGSEEVEQVDALLAALDAHSSAIDAMPKQLTMSPEVVEIVERLSKLPPFAWPAWDARVLLGFCVLHAAHATVSAPTDGKGQP